MTKGAEQARYSAASTARIKAINILLKKGGVVTTSNATSQQWDAPNGWAPLQLFAVEGLRNYGFEMQAQTIMLRFCKVSDQYRPL